MSDSPTVCIVNGLARSGTTFLAAVLHSLPGVFFFQESFRLPQYYQTMHGVAGYPFSLTAWKRAPETDFRKAIPSYESFERECVRRTLSRLNDARMEREIREGVRASFRAGMSYVDAFSAFYRVVAEKSGAKVVGGKTTFCHMYRTSMLDSIPGLKWITIVRDVRGVMASGARLFYDLEGPIFYDYWGEQVRCLQPPVSDDRFLIVRYEDLVMSKRETVTSIAKFLGLCDFDYAAWEGKKILKNDGSEFGVFSSFNESGERLDGYAHRGGESFDSRRVGHWRSFLTGKETAVLTRFYRRELDRIGYPVGFQRNADRFKGWVSHIKMSCWRAAWRALIYWRQNLRAHRVDAS